MDPHLKPVEIEYRKSIGKKLKLARSNCHYTQEGLAEKLSLSPKFISQLECGHSFGSAHTIVSICKALNISAAFLFDDLIDIEVQNELPPLDVDFLKVYIQLDDYNKEVLRLFAEHILRLQNNYNSSKPNKKIGN